MGRSGGPLGHLTFDFSQVPFPPYSCRRCEYVFEYPEDAPLNHVIQLVYGHQSSCFSGTRLLPSKEVTNANEKHPREDREASPAATKRARTMQQAPLEPHKRRKKNVMDERTRRQLIERDSWGKNATSKSVECRGCGKTIKLDKRSQYYPGLWHKHRNKCPDIQRLEAQGGKATDNFRKTCVGRREFLTREATPSSSGESLSETSTTRERVLQWTATLRSQYDAVPSHVDMHRITTSGRSEDDNGRKIVVSRPQSSIYARGNTATTLTGAQDPDETYWESAPFQPGKDDDPGATQSEGPEKRQRYRYSTRRELLKKPKDSEFIDNQGVKFSEDVIQAALCLISMKSRAPTFTNTHQT